MRDECILQGAIQYSGEYPDKLWRNGPCDCPCHGHMQQVAQQVEDDGRQIFEILFWHSASFLNHEQNDYISFTELLFDCRQWNEELLEEACASLAEEMSLSPSAPGGMVTYRRTLTISLFYKFFLTVQHKLALNLQMEVFFFFFVQICRQSSVWQIPKQK